MKTETAMIIFGKNRLRWGLFIYTDVNVDDEMMNLPGRDSDSEIRLEPFKKTVESPPAPVYLCFISTSVLEFVKP